MKTRKKDERKNILVAVSVLAMRALAPSPGFAQVLISCPGGVQFGRLATYGIGELVLTAKGATSTTGTHAIIDQVAAEGQCFVKTGGVAPTKDVEVSFTVNFINIMNGGTDAKVDNFRMYFTGTATQQNKLTLTPAEVSNTVTISIGATLNFDGNQPIGNYVGSIRVQTTP